MAYSATRLGLLFKLSATEMNVVLKLLGYQDGEPGYYNVTSKGYDFVIYRENYDLWKEEILPYIQNEINEEIIKDAKEYLANRKELLKKQNDLYNKSIEKVTQTIAEVKTEPLIKKIITNDYVKISAKNMISSLILLLAPLITKKVIDYIDEMKKEKNNAIK